MKTENQNDMANELKLGTYNLLRVKEPARREGFGEVRDAFRRGIVEEDEAAALGSGAEGAEDGGGFSLECG